MSEFFNQYARAHKRPHHISESFYNVMQEIEKLPASEQQTKCVIALNELKDKVAEEIRKYENRLVLR